MNDTLDVPLLQSIATRMINTARVTAHGKILHVGRTSVHHLRTVRFTMNGREYQAIEQNPEAGSSRSSSFPLMLSRRRPIRAIL